MIILLWWSAIEAAIDAAAEYVSDAYWAAELSIVLAQLENA